MSRSLPESPEHLAALLEEAGRTLLSAAMRGTRPSGACSWWPEVVHAFEEAYGYSEEDVPLPAPSARAITRMDSAHDWIRLIPLQPGRAGSGQLFSSDGGAVLRRLVWLRSLVNPRTGRHLYSWRRLGRVFHASHTAVADWHSQGLGVILSTLYRAEYGSRAPALLAAMAKPAPRVARAPRQRIRAAYAASELAAA